MSVLFWNCRGAASGKLARTLKVLVQKHSIKLVALFEPRVSGDRAVKLGKKLGFEDCIIEEAQGFSGGIWILWCFKVFTVKVIEQTNQFLHVKILKNGELFTFLTAIYANPMEEKRQVLWQDLRRLSSQAVDPWIMGGDFNEIAHGPKWGHLDRIFKRLDIICANKVWRLKFADAWVRVLPRVQSDHSPLLIEFNGNHISLGTRPFRFVAAWQQHPQFNLFLDEYWSKSETCSNMLTRLVPPLKQWNINVFGNIWKRKKAILNSIYYIQQQKTINESFYLTAKENRLQDELTNILEQEELLWFQKSRERWNTRFYHLKTIIRRSTNKILRLKNDMQLWISDQKALQHMA
ncbi:uncharacterized protein LOC133296386 [Gastrolobium bilobum]|uniref:uncharacterized protein LOC133296386 n=1 Tax=Gastrolobium bilobum TaxID=150636 RepID=UPI002AB212B7|nr:uncharacterized protein LOC133296386 [Gastrolobium bilobum]